MPLIVPCYKILHYEQCYQDNVTGEVVNNASQLNINSELMKMMQSLQQELNQVKMHMTTPSTWTNPQQTYTPTPPPWGTNQDRGQGGRGRGGRGGRGRGRNQLQRKNTRYYC